METEQEKMNILLMAENDLFIKLLHKEMEEKSMLIEIISFLLKKERKSL